MPNKKIDIFPLKLSFSKNQFPWEEQIFEEFDFQSPKALLEHLATSEGDDNARFQGGIDKQLKSNLEVADWHRQRTPFSKMPHFSRYKGNEYDAYHSAARSIAAGNGSQDDRGRFDGLRSEIEKRGVPVPEGQTLFHGRSNDNLSSLKPYTSFVSTSLEPVVAINSASRRFGSSGGSGGKYVYVLHLSSCLRAIWGHWHNNCEWEVLLPPNLNFNETMRCIGKNFTIVEAQVSVP